MANICSVRIGLLVGLVTMGPSISCAQTDDFTAQYDAFKQQTRRDYGDFRNQCNAKYAEFLKQVWSEYKVLPAIPRPKDETIPPTDFPKDKENSPIKNNEVSIDGVIISVTPPQPTPIAPIQENKETEEKSFTFYYMNTPCQVRLPQDLHLHLSNNSNEAIAQAWNILAGDKMNNTIRDFLLLRLKMQLCDWAYLNIIDAFAKASYGNSNEATLLSAFIYCQSGYQMRLARTGNRLCMLYGSKHCIYEKEHFVIDDTNYYTLDQDVATLEICNFAFPQEQPLSLYISQSPLLANKSSEKRILKASFNTDMHTSVEVNMNLIRFYEKYPTSQLGEDFMTRWAMYAETPMANDIKTHLYPSLRDMLEGLTDLEAANKLLNWVQTAFVYEYDDKVWGHDRAFFAEETLYYPYCDCEDRAILFTRLVRDLLGLKCALVYYPGHLASAINFGGGAKGDFLLIDGIQFTICDPTYIGAPVGRTMPQLDNRSATVILLQ